MSWPDNNAQLAMSGNDIQGIINPRTGGVVGIASPYTWATKPLASAYIGTAFITDVGTGGSYWISNGTEWKPSGGRCVIYTTAVAGSPLTGTLADSTLVTVPLPANILGLNGAVYVYAKLSATIVTTSSTFFTKIGGTIASGFGFAVASPTTGIGNQVFIQNRNSASSKIGSNGTSAGVSGTAGTAWTTLSIDTSIAQNLTYTVVHGNVGSTVTVESFMVEIINP